MLTMSNECDILIILVNKNILLLRKGENYDGTYEKNERPKMD